MSVQSVLAYKPKTIPTPSGTLLWNLVHAYQEQADLLETISRLNGDDLQLDAALERTSDILLREQTGILEEAAAHSPASRSEALALLKLWHNEVIGSGDEDVPSPTDRIILSVFHWLQSQDRTAE